MKPALRSCINTRPPLILLMAACLQLGIASGCGRAVRPDDHLVGYKEQAVTDYLRRYGFQGQVHASQAWQSASGTKLYFLDDAWGDDPTDDVYVLSADRPEPLRIRLPRGHWLDAHDQPLSPPAFLGAGKYPSMGEVDRQSGFFMQRDMSAGVIRLGHFERPDGWLCEFPFVSEQFYPSYIHAARNAVVLAESKVSGPMTCWVLRPDPSSPNGWSKVERTMRFGAWVGDPFNRRLLVASGGFYMFIPVVLAWYDIDSGETTRLGRMIDRMYFIMANNFLSERLKGKEKVTLIVDR